jgi:hypothetical protein
MTTFASTLLLLSASVSAAVAANQPPTATSATVTTKEDSKLVITLKGADPEKKKLTYALVTQPAYGTVTLKGGIATYTPAANYFNTATNPDRFTFKTNDGVLDSSPATVTLVVTAVNDVPTVQNSSATAIQDTAVDIALLGSDVDGDPLTYVPSKSKSGGTVVVKSGNIVTFTPKKGYLGMDSFTFTAKDNNKGISKAATVSILVKAVSGPVVQPTPTGKLNDTGITKCGNGSASNLACPQADYPGQDAEYGRDADQATNNDYDGHAGFSYTKISNSGQALPVTATQWGCVKDNVTGLIWEIKQGTPNKLTGDAGLHDPDDIYAWYEPDNSKNGGFAGYQKPSDSNASNTDNVCYGHAAGNVATYCNTKAYVNRVNTAGWCGANDWRMPTITELQSIVSRDRSAPAIDTAWFPNMPESNFYWSSSPDATSSSAAWYIPFSYAQTYSYYIKSSRFKIRLVRGTN